MYLQRGFRGRTMKRSEFDVVQTLSNINRFSNLRNNKEQTVADHSYRVAMLCTFICDEINDRVAKSKPIISTKTTKSLRKLDYSILTKFALFHDVEEAFVGDIPYPYKSSPHYQNEREWEFVSAQMINQNIFGKYRRFIGTQVRPQDYLEYSIMKFCDMFDLVCFSHAEVESGNQHFIHVLYTGIEVCFSIANRLNKKYCLKDNNLAVISPEWYEYLNEIKSQVSTKNRADLLFV
jgi:5'-deoxynucleotidase YfbR-like HD superfamily hydrolase